MAEVLGVVVNAMKAFLNQRFGQEAVEKGLSDLSAEDRALVERRFLDSAAYPYSTMVAMRRLMRPLAKAAPRSAADVGAFIADQVFTGVYKTFLVDDPAKMVEKIPWVKNFFYRDTDKVDVHMTGPKSCVLRYTYEEGVRPTRGVCLSLIGFWGRTLEMSSGSKVAATHSTCICDGAGHCEFAFSW